MDDSKIVLATEADARDLASATDTKASMTRAERRQLEKAADKERSDGLKAVTVKNLPKIIANVLSKHVMPMFQELSHGVGQTAFDVMALVEVLEEKGLLTQAEVAARCAALKEAMRQELMLEAQAKQAAAEEALAFVNEQSPAFQEATGAAGGAKVVRLDEGGPPSKLISL